MRLSFGLLVIVLCCSPFERLVAESRGVATELSVAVEQLLVQLEPAADRPFSAAAGKETWYREQAGRSCTSCHTDSLEVAGRHQKTGKLIEPMAPSVNPERLTERRKISKWLLRNCKWTYGRECTPQEKGDILVWLSTQ